MKPSTDTAGASSAQATLLTSIFALVSGHSAAGSPKPRGRTFTDHHDPQVTPDSPGSVTPIPCHSHNDYWRPRPLFSALEVGCWGVEADVWVFEGEVYVGHKRGDLVSDRTLSTLYLDPLTLLLSNGSWAPAPVSRSTASGGYESGQMRSLVLLLDLKSSDGTNTAWKVVLDRLEPLRRRGWLSSVQDGIFLPGPITIVGTGSSPFEASTSTRHTFFDAPLANLDDDAYNSSNSYYASASLPGALGRVGRDGLSASQISKMREQIRKAHGKGLKVRYWGLPVWPISRRNSVWRSLIAEGADILNADALHDVAEFLSLLRL